LLNSLNWQLIYLQRKYTKILQIAIYCWFFGWFGYGLKVWGNKKAGVTRLFIKI